MAFIGVTNAHGPSPQPTACRSPTCSLTTTIQLLFENKLDLAADRFEPRRSVVLRRRRVAQHLRLLGKDQEGPRAARHVLRLQDGGRLLVQGEAQA